ncbi:MAG: MFS transporter [Paucibacter sp.]|nr:MFS transporter [Roseateles sp.]
MLAAAVVALFGIGMCGFLAYFKFESALEAAARSRMAVPAASVREGVEAALALGVPLAGASETPALLERERGVDAAITSISVHDERGRVLFSAGAPMEGSDELRMPLRNSFDLRLGEVVVRYSQDAEDRALVAMRARLLRIAAASAAGTLLIAALVLARRPRRPALVILLAVMVGMLLASWATHEAFQAGLRPALQAKARVVGTSVGELVGKALDHGLGLTELVGVRAHLQELRQEHPELAYLALRDAAAAVLFDAGHAEEVKGIEVPLVSEGRRVGAVEAQVSAGYIQHILLESALDLGVVFVVAMFLTRELLHGITGVAAAETPGEATLARLRVPLFLFMLAEELTRAFLPGHARTLMPVGSTISPELIAGLPIAVFMGVVALGQPLLAPWSERAGHRRTLLRGAALGVLGLGGAATAGGILSFMAWRALCGLGWGMVFVAGQGLVIDNTSAAQRTRGFAIFVGAIMVAAVCGPPIGGMLADHLGPRWAFAVAAVIAAAACVAARGLPAAQASTTADAPPGLRDFARIFGQGRFLWITALAALPAKLILAGSCFYLVPLYVIAAGAPPSVAGRALMLYAVVLVLVLPQGTRWVERGVPLSRLVGVGLCLSSLGALALILLPGLAPVYAVTALMGLGQGVSIAAQSSLLAQVCAPEIAAHGAGPVFGAYRLVERLGNASGPLLAAGLAVWVGQAGAFLGLAALILLSGLVFLVMAGRAQA